MGYLTASPLCTAPRNSEMRAWAYELDRLRLILTRPFIKLADKGHFPLCKVG